jgi:hypothetical protein
MAAQTPDWILQAGQQIQVIDYELHAAIRIISRGEMKPEHVLAFMEACMKRDRLMARVVSYVASRRKQAADQAAVVRSSKP